jgi:ABC-type lipoprotein release transport system permease subunit
MLNSVDQESWALTAANIGLGIAALIFCLVVMRGFLRGFQAKKLDSSPEFDSAGHHDLANLRSAVSLHHRTLSRFADEAGGSVLNHRAPGIRRTSGSIGHGNPGSGTGNA